MVKKKSLKETAWRDHKKKNAAHGRILVHFNVGPLTAASFVEPHFEEICVKHFPLYTNVFNTAGTHGKIAVVGLLPPFPVFFFSSSSSGPDAASPLLGTSAITCSPTLNSELLKTWIILEREGDVYVDVCACVHLYLCLWVVRWHMKT